MSSVRRSSGSWRNGLLIPVLLILALAATGLSGPLLRAIGLSELSFALSPVSTRVQVGKRLVNNLYISYLSSVAGTAKTSLFRLTYDITPEIAAGISINELQQTRYELQTTRSF